MNLLIVNGLLLKNKPEIVAEGKKGNKMDCRQIDAPFIPLDSGVPRSKDKLHVTTVMKAISEEMGWGYKGKGFEDIGLTMSIGFLWEDVLSLAYGNRLGARIGEVELDGIIGSPDGIGLDDPEFECDIWPKIDSGNVVLEEYKATWKGSKNSPIQDWYYVTQIMSYCTMLNLDTVIMHMVYLMGNYKGSGPQYRRARIVFNQYELQQNWDMILTAAKKIKE